MGVSAAAPLASGTLLVSLAPHQPLSTHSSTWLPSCPVKFGGTKLVDGHFLGVLYAQDSDLQQGIYIGLLQAWDATPLGNVIESKVLKTTIGVCALLLGHFPTTITEDEATLQSKELREAGRLALEYRIAKKKVLVGCMQGISQKLYSVGKEKD